jgi:hypothetical protein
MGGKAKGIGAGILGGAAVGFGASQLGKKSKKSKTAQYIERPGEALLKDMPNYEQAAQKATAARLAEIERVMPGATAQRQQAGDITAAWMRRELPQDVQEQTMRNIAEFGGAGFNPATAGRAGGFQMAQGMVPRQFGLQSTQLQEKGISTAMGWQQLADSFAYDPFEASQYASPSQAYGQQKASAIAYDEKVNAANQAAQTNKMIGTIGTVAAIGAAPFTGGASLSFLPTTMGMMGGGSAGGAGGGGGGGMGGIGQFGGGGGMGFTNPFAAQSVTGYKGQTYVPEQGGSFYRLASSSAYGR